eukprot:6139-Heterococcus_DN1.PRE.1
MVCNTLLPAPTFSSQFAAHVRSSHSCGAGERSTIAMTAASEASDLVSITPDKPMRQGKQRSRKHPMCQDPACTGTQASYGYEQDKKLIRCAKHIEEGMMYLRAKQCEDPTCNKRASFGQPDTKLLVNQENPARPAHLANNVAITADASHHVKSGSSILCYAQECNHGEPVDAGAAVFVGTAARCRNYEACGKQATFGYKGKLPIYCKTCIPVDLKDDLVDTKHKRCEHEGCDTQPSFGKPGDTVAPFCYAHRLKDMINVRRPICEDCKQRINTGGFKMKGDKRVRWCIQCSCKHAGAVPGRPIRDKIKKAATKLACQRVAYRTRLHAAATLNTTASCCWSGIAINAANKSALQLICNNCDVQSVQLLLDAGGWLTCNSFKCPLGATRAGNAEVLELLLSAATATAAATTASDSGSSDSSSGHMCCIQATTATSDLNLLHVAAAVRSLSCAELLVRHGVDATAVSKATSDEQRSRLSPLDLLLYDLRFLHFDELQLPPD